LLEESGSGVVGSYSLNSNEKKCRYVLHAERVASDLSEKDDGVRRIGMGHTEYFIEWSPQKWNR
jgi:hypothetical protein